MTQVRYSFSISVLLSIGIWKVFQIHCIATQVWYSCANRVWTKETDVSKVYLPPSPKIWNMQKIQNNFVLRGMGGVLLIKSSSSGRVGVLRVLPQPYPPQHWNIILKQVPTWSSFSKISKIFFCSICPAVSHFFLRPSHPPMNQIKLTPPIFCSDFYSKSE